MTMKHDSFAAFILTHGRPDRVDTIETLRKCGYTGKIYLICDDEDIALDEYKKRYQDKVLVFSKKEIAHTFDEGDNFKERRGVVYARNACFDIAKKVGVKYFFQLDDDYKEFSYKFNEQHQYGRWKIKDLDSILDILVDYYVSINVHAIAMAQDGDFIGGGAAAIAQKIKPSRKVMNTFICSTDRPFKFIGRINEDVNAYALGGFQGKLFFTIPILSVNQKVTQSNESGMTDLYLDYGTYVKSFYSVMYCPSFVKVAEMITTHRRLHHKLTWNNAVPQIVDEKFRKISK